MNCIIPSDLVWSDLIWSVSLGYNPIFAQILGGHAKQQVLDSLFLYSQKKAIISDKWWMYQMESYRPELWLSSVCWKSNTSKNMVSMMILLGYCSSTWLLNKVWPNDGSLAPTICCICPWEGLRPEEEQIEPLCVRTKLCLCQCACYQNIRPRWLKTHQPWRKTNTPISMTPYGMHLCTRERNINGQSENPLRQRKYTE